MDCLPDAKGEAYGRQATVHEGSCYYGSLTAACVGHLHAAGSAPPPCRRTSGRVLPQSLLLPPLLAFQPLGWHALPACTCLKTASRACTWSLGGTGSWAQWQHHCALAGRTHSCIQARPHPARRCTMAPAEHLLWAHHTFPSHLTHTSTHSPAHPPTVLALAQDRLAAHPSPGPPPPHSRVWPWPLTWHGTS